MGTIMVLSIVTVIVGCAVYSMIKDKKKGKSIHCGCDCKDCGGNCH